MMRSFRRWKALSIAFVLGLSLSIPLSLWRTTPSQAAVAVTQNLTRYTLTAVDLKTTGATTVFTSNTGARFHPLFVVFEVESATALSVGATVSLGVTAAAYTDVVAGVTVGTTASKMLPNSLSALTDSVAPGTAVRVNVSIAAIGTSGTFRVDVIGYYD